MQKIQILNIAMPHQHSQLPSIQNKQRCPVVICIITFDPDFTERLRSGALLRHFR